MSRVMRLMLLGATAYGIKKLVDRQMGGSMTTQGGMQGIGNERDLITRIGLGGLVAMQAGRLAASKGTTQQIRDFGQRIVDDHLRMGEQISPILRAVGLRMGKRLDSDGKLIVSQLSNLSGRMFDHAFIDEMVNCHLESILILQDAVSRIGNEDVRDIANRTLRMLQEHLSVARDIRQSFPDSVENMLPGAGTTQPLAG